MCYRAYKGKAKKGVNYIIYPLPNNNPRLLLLRTLASNLS